MAEPVLLLLDEPSMGLAPLIVEEIFSIIAGPRYAAVTSGLRAISAAGPWRRMRPVSST
jgi:ABC-type transporter Mla maintaining outer membrane lipid asymmetry ATPase subunit MlaF